MAMWLSCAYPRTSAQLEFPNRLTEQTYTFDWYFVVIKLFPASPEKAITFPFNSMFEADAA